MATDSTDTDRWDNLRAHGQRIHSSIHDLAQEVGLDTPLDALAFVVGTSRMVDPVSEKLAPFNLRMHEAKVAAREHGATWLDLALAMGECEPDDDEQTQDRAKQRTRARFNDNATRLDELRAA